MRETTKINTEVLDGLIFGRVEPYIYAFSTKSVPDYLKVGDTYRPLESRLNEWRKYFPDLEKKFESKASVDDKTFFRDHAVHLFLERDLKKKRLKKGSIANLPHYSNEFFRETDEKDLERAIADIKNSFKNNEPKYQYYSFDESRVPLTHTYKRTEEYEPRPNQRETINNFNKAIKKGRSNLLMYAVMRFGKSFTSMCCAVEMKAKLVVVLSAKADVKEEWKKTVESHIKFNGYEFLDSSSLLKSKSILTSRIKSQKKTVLFLTLQDLQGDQIKTKHKEIFEHQVDLLLIDETHFGARAKEYGKILRLDKKEAKSEQKLDDNDIDDLEPVTKIIKSKVRIHLSGTPYRILMNSEFTKEDIIAFYQFSDIARDQKEWDLENISKNGTEEWDNPYYGFPQMIRFAFNPNESSRKCMEEMRKNGTSYAFSALFRPESIVKDRGNNQHKKFNYEQEVTDLLRVIDGSQEDENLLGFLDYAKIKAGKMCRHIVCVLPYRASCDALEELIKSNDFKNLNDYEIINISGVDNDKKYPNTKSVQSEITKYEKENKKTITLTVNRMLTGSTVPQWDTMLFLKDTASPQEYDQAIFRLQSQYVRTYKEPDGDTVKYNMKPQTLLVDFDPNRMFRMQEQKSQIYNANIEKNGNNKLKDRIEKELEISPIVVLNKHKIVQVTPTDITNAISQYSSTRSVFDEASTISVDESLLEIAEIKAEIEKQGEIGSRQGMEIPPSEGVGDDLDIEVGDKKEKDKEEKDTSDAEAEVNYKAKFAMYYARILFFAFLSDSEVESLGDIIEEVGGNPDNSRIATNIGLEKEILVLFQEYINHFVLSELDYKIQNINSLNKDPKLSPLEKANNAMKKFGRLSDSEIVTPKAIAKKITESLPLQAVGGTKKMLDISSKEGEFTCAVYEKNNKSVANHFYSIPTSKIAYEFTRKVYKLLGLDVDLIECDHVSSDFIKKENKLVENNEIKINNKSMKFDVIVGNPPYQQKDGGAQASAKPIYNQFVDVAKQLDPDYISMIIPTRWYAGGKGLDNFRDEMLNDKHISELHDFLKPEIIFDRINLRGGVCYFLRDKNYDNIKDLTKVYTYQDTLTSEPNTRKLKTEDCDIFIRHNSAVKILQKVRSQANFESLAGYVSSRKPFGLEGNVVKDSSIFRKNKQNMKDAVVCYGKGGKEGFVEKNKIIKNKEWIKKYKVFAPYANNIGTELNDDNLNSFLGEPNTICTETYIVIGAGLGLKKNSAENLSKYLTTRFARFMHSIAKISQHATAKTYKFVPLQDFSLNTDINWKNTVENIDKQLYEKYGLTKKEVAFIESLIKPMA